jgi:phage baseplate assembly protein W
MAIKLKTLERVADNYTKQRYVYKDLNFDLSFEKVFPIGYTTAVNNNDLKTNFDFEAVRNSLQNLFNTLPGQRFLFPEYGLDFNQFLFLPITENNGRAIGERLLNTIEKFEPRIIIQNVEVVADPDNNLYLFKIVVLIPVLNRNTALTGELNIKTSSFILLPTSRNL